MSKLVFIGLKEAQSTAEDFINEAAEAIRERTSISDEGDIYCLRDDMETFAKLHDKVWRAESTEDILKLIMSNGEIMSSRTRKKMTRMFKDVK
jgi:hypothetical protein